jgi:hypothetical protein
MPFDFSELSCPHPMRYLLLLIFILSAGAKASTCSEANPKNLFCADFDRDDLSQWDALSEAQGEYKVKIIKDDKISDN